MSNVELKKYDKSIRGFIVYNGSGLDEFYRPAFKGRGTEFYVKLYIHLFDYRLKDRTKNLDYYVSTNGLKELFNCKLHYSKDGKVTKTGYGNHYCTKTIQRALQRLLRLKLISYKIAPKKADRENPYEFQPHRTINVDMETAKQLFNVYEPDVDKFIIEYAMKLAIDEVDEDKNLLEEEKDHKLQSLYTQFKKWLTKIAKKRPFNFTEKATEKYQEYEEAGISQGKYSNAGEMISYYQYHIARKYTRRNMFKKYLPTHLRDKQKEADEAIATGTSPYGNLTEEDIKLIRMLPVPDAWIYVQKLIGFKIPTAELQHQAVKAFIKVDLKEHKVLDYNIDEAKIYCDTKTFQIDFTKVNGNSNPDTEITCKYKTGGFDPL